MMSGLLLPRDPQSSTDHPASEACRSAAYAVWIIGALPLMLCLIDLAYGPGSLAQRSRSLIVAAPFGLLGLGLLLRLRIAVWATMLLSSLAGVGILVWVALVAFGALGSEGASRSGMQASLLLGACFLAVAMPRLWRLDQSLSSSPRESRLDLR